MKRNKRTWFSALLALLVTFVLAACGNGNQAPADDAANAGDAEESAQMTEEAANDDQSEDLEKLTVILDYVPNTNHTGLYVAKDKGYFKDAGLDIEVIEPGEGQTSNGIVGANKAQFGFSIQEDVTYAHQGEEQIPVKALATVLQHNTSGFYSLKERNITTPKDFEGKTYAGWIAPTEEAVIKAVVEDDGGDYDKVNIIGDPGGGPQDLTGDIDLKWFFEGWDAIFAERAGLDLNYIPVRDLDERLDYYTPVVIGNEDYIKENPEITKKFIQALKKGYQDAIADPEEATDILANYTEGVDKDDLLASQEYLSAHYTDDPEHWGHMEKRVWDGYTEFMFERDLIDRDIPAEEMFTNEFLGE